MKTASRTTYRPRFDFAGGDRWPLYLGVEPGIAWTTDPDHARAFATRAEALAAGAARRPEKTTLRVERVAPRG